MAFLVLNMKSFSQSVYLPDPSMRQVLMENYPFVMKEDSLLINEAKVLIGSLNLSNANISDAHGVEYFESLTTLDLSFNNLNTIPVLNNLTQIQNIYLNHNNIDSLPSFINNRLLKNFQAHYNALTIFPTFGNNQNLKEIFCNNNLIRTIPDLDSLPNLEILVIGINPIENNPNYGVLRQLTELHVHDMDIDTIIGLDQLDKLEILYAWGNNIRDLSDLNTNTTLRLINIGTNNLTELPILNNKPFLFSLNVDANYLSFSDLSVIDTNKLITFEYSPQNKFSLPNQTKREKQNVSFDLNFDNNLSNNIYVWKKGSEKLDSSNSSSFTIENLNFVDSGEYSVDIYNSSLPKLILSSNTFNLTVTNCMSINQLNPTIVKSNCKEGYSVSLSNLIIEGGVQPFKYTVQGLNFYHSSFNNFIEKIPSGEIKITISDVNNCQIDSSIYLNKVNDCDDVFTPNGDGVSDTYLIDYEGQVEIFNTQRKKVADFNIPFNWDGNDNNSNPLDSGLYALIINGQKVVYVTILK